MYVPSVCPHTYLPLCITVDSCTTQKCRVFVVFFFILSEKVRTDLLWVSSRDCWFVLLDARTTLAGPDPSLVIGRFIFTDKLQFMQGWLTVQTRGSLPHLSVSPRLLLAFLPWGASQLLTCLPAHPGSWPTS